MDTPNANNNADNNANNNNINNTNNNNASDDFWFWKVGTTPPQGLPTDSFLSRLLVPRPMAWVCIYDNNTTSQEEETPPRVCLLEGYNGASDRPPTIMLASKALPSTFVDSLRSCTANGDGGFCSLSVVTVRDKETLLRLRSLQQQQQEEMKKKYQYKDDYDDDSTPISYSLEDLGLEAQDVPTSLISYDDNASTTRTTNNNNTVMKRRRRPPGIKSSPIQMHCKLVMDIELNIPNTNSHDSTNNYNNNKLQEGPKKEQQSILMLEIEHFFIRGDVLRKQPSVPRQTVIYTHDNPDVRKISAKIEADLVQPVCSLGPHKFGQLEQDGIYHMCRPIRSLIGSATTHDSTNNLNDNNSSSSNTWIVDTFRKMKPIHTTTTSSTVTHLANVEFNYRNEPYCKLGYNPTKQIVAPRPIGWLSTYAKEGEGSTDTKISHIAPYSFFIDVGRGDETSMVAFIACHREDDDDDDEDDFQLNHPRNNEEVLGNTIITTNNNNIKKKDAHRDAEETGVFAWNMVSKDLAVEMNYSAAELERSESEFDMARVQPLPARIIDAPIVPFSPVIFECQYVRTLVVPRSKPTVERQWYCIVGHIIAVHIRKDALVVQRQLPASSSSEDFEAKNTAMQLDIEKIKPIARLGYEQEYGVIVPFL